MEEEVDIRVAMDRAGCGFGTFLYCGGPFLFYCLEGAEIVVLSIVGLMLQCEWELTPFWVSALQMNVLLVIIVVSVFSGRLGDRFGRRPVCLGAAIGTTLAGFAAGFAQNYWQLFATRVVLGVCLGIGSPSALAMGGEIPPTSFRALSLSAVSLAFGIGASVTSAIAYFVVDPYGWRGLLIATALTFSPSILLLLLIRESPRHEATQGRLEEAEVTIKQIYRLNCRPISSLKLKRDAVEEEELSDFKMVARSLREEGDVANLVAVCLLGTFSYFAYYIVGYSAPRFLNEGYCLNGEVNTKQECVFAKSILFDIGVVSLSEPLAVSIAIVLVDVIGRRKTFFISVILSLVFITTLYFCAGRYYLLAFLTLMRMGIAQLAWSPTLLGAEYFPTSIRSFVMGLHVSCARVGASLGVLCAQYVFNYSPWLLLGMLQVGVVLSGLCLIQLKKETMGTHLT